MMKKLRPTIVLAVITTLISALLIVTYKFTYKDDSNVMTDAMLKSCVEIMGEGDYEIVPEADWKPAETENESLESVSKLIRKSDGSLAFEVVTSGYSKNGLDVLVAVNSDGTVKGVSIISLTETPGLGTKVQDESFLSQFNGVTGAKIGGSTAGMYKKESKTDESVSADAAAIDAVTSATYSSKGVVSAVNIAIAAFNEIGGAK